MHGWLVSLVYDFDSSQTAVANCIHDRSLFIFKLKHVYFQLHVLYATVFHKIYAELQINTETKNSRGIAKFR